MKFVADVMLGSLAKLMRFQGYDVEYSNRIADEELRKRSRYRVLLTKDRELSRQVSPGNVYLVQSIGGAKQLREIKKHFPAIDFAPRCIECNSKLRAIRKGKIEHLVPPFVYKKHLEFFHCRTCTRIYWTGTHFEGMIHMLK